MLAVCSARSAYPYLPVFPQARWLRLDLLAQGNQKPPYGVGVKSSNVTWLLKTARFLATTGSSGLSRADSLFPAFYYRECRLYTQLPYTVSQGARGAVEGRADIVLYHSALAFRSGTSYSQALVSGA